MASRKKGKKSKWQAVPLTDLLPETPGGMPAMPVKVSSWADDVDDDHGFQDMYSSRKPQEPVVLPTAPRAARGPGIDEENIPMNPPFVAYVSNLPYDVIEEDLLEFFADMQVTNMRLPKELNKLKGYGYVDFDDRQSLIDALSMTNTSIKGRRVRIEVSNSNSDDRRGGRMGGMGRDYGRREYDDADRNSDWRSGPRDDPPPGDGDRFRSRGGGGGGGFDRERRDDRESSASDNKPGAWREARAPLPDLPDRGSDRGNDRGSDRGFGERRGFRSDDKDREFSRFGDRGSRDNDGGERGGDRGGDRGGSSFGPRRNFGDRERERDRDSASDWGNRLSSRPAASSDAPSEPEPSRTRQKLNLQPRTKPIDSIEPPKDLDAEKPESREERPAPVAPVPAVNIFGAAKPVDTTAREREIEERLAKTYAESKPKTEDGDRKGPKEGTWARRNGEGRSDHDKERPRPAWRSDEDRGRNADRPASRQPASGRSEPGNDSRGPPPSRSGGPAARGAHRASDSRGPSERERKDRDKEDGIPPMPKATDEQAPNFVASNKYSMLPEDVDSDNSNN